VYKFRVQKFVIAWYFFELSYLFLDFGNWLTPWSMFGSVVAGAFQITFRAKMHANDVFLFFKNYFWHQHIKTIQTIQTILNFSKKKKFKFFGNTAAAAFPNMLLMSLFLRYNGGLNIIAAHYGHHSAGI